MGWKLHKDQPKHYPRRWKIEKNSSNLTLFLIGIERRVLWIDHLFELWVRLGSVLDENIHPIADSKCKISSIKMCWHWPIWIRRTLPFTLSAANWHHYFVCWRDAHFLPRQVSGFFSLFSYYIRSLFCKQNRNVLDHNPSRCVIMTKIRRQNKKKLRAEKK